jgi:hypothetical protein
LAPCARAGQHDLVDLTVTHPRQLAEVAAGLRDVIGRQRLCRINGELVEAVEYGTRPREHVEGAVCSLRKFEALLYSEQPLDEPVQLLSADEGYMGEAFPGLREEMRTSRICAFLSWCRVTLASDDPQMW